MKRSSILAIGFGMLLGVGLLTPGCGDSGGGSKDASADAKKDALSTGGVRGTGGSVGSGGTRATGGSGGGSGGVAGSGGTGGSAGSGGTAGSGGSSGTGGATILDDGGPKLDVAPDGRRDTNADQGSSDARDVAIQDPETGIDMGPVQLDTGSVDVSIDQAGIDSPIILDTSIDEGTVDAEEIDTSGLDTSNG